MDPRPVTLQWPLFRSAEVSFDQAFARLERLWLDERAWVDFAPAWVKGDDRLFEQIVQSQSWGQRSRLMYGRELPEPRLTAYWHLGSENPLQPPIVEELRRSLSERYSVTFDSVGFNLYRDGQDSVAWHRDQIDAKLTDPIVVLVSLGERRRFQLRPRGGGPTRSFLLGRGDLLVTGGQTQRTWEHTVPKVAQAGPRISLAFRYGLRSRAYPAEPSPGTY